MKTVDRYDVLTVQNSGLAMLDLKNDRLDHMNDYADTVVRNGSSNVGYCDARLFGYIFYGEPIAMPFSEERTRNRNGKQSRVFEDANVVKALHRASLVPRVAGQLFTADTEMFPKDYSNVGLILSGDPLINSRGVRYQVRKLNGAERGRSILQGLVSFSSISTSAVTGKLTDQEVALLQVGRNYEDDQTRTALPMPSMSLGDHEVRKTYGLSHILTIENAKLEERRDVLQAYTRGRIS